MFTGIVQELGTVKAVRRTKAGRRLVVRSKLRPSAGDSIAINGVCLTAIEDGKGELSFDVIPETLSKTNLGRLKKGSRVNLESSLRAGDPIGGHFVQGHIEGTGFVKKVSKGKDGVVIRIAVDPSLSEHMIPKGGIAVDGVSLTVVEVEEEEFSIALIPFTLKHTTLGTIRRGGPVNIETDMLGKYARGRGRGVTKSTLKKAGFI